MKSVKKKRSFSGRVLALFSALLVLASVLIIPLSAAEYTESDVTLGGVDDWKSFDYILGTDSGPFLDGLPMETVNPDPLVQVPKYSAANPFAFTLSDFSVEWNQDQWTYVSVELAVFEDGSHWTVGFWERTGGSGAREVVYRLMYYDAGTGASNIKCFETVLPEVSTTRPEVIAEYWSENVPGGGYRTMCRVFFGADNPMYDYSYTFTIGRPFKVRVKTEYAQVSYTKTVGDAYPQSPSYEAGYAEGETDGSASGYVNGYIAGGQKVFQMFFDAYREAGGTAETLNTGQYNVILDYFKDVGWTEAVNQGSLTGQLIFTALEAPLNVIMGGLNFNLFGINVAETIFAIFSLIVIFAVVRVVLAVLPLV